jgi:C-terminal processing protease CtpA/Prc
VIGEQTFGGAFGNTVPHRLPDGCDLLLPEIQVVTPAEWSRIENCGYAPDVHAPWCADEQTPDKALMLALRELDVRDTQDGSA